MTFDQIAVQYGGALAQTRMVRPDVAHLRLADGSVLVVELDQDGAPSRVYTAVQYAGVDLDQVRDENVRAKWDVRAPWPA